MVLLALPLLLTACVKPSSSSGKLVNSAEELYGTWVLVEKTSKVEDFSRTEKFDTDASDAEVYTFDRINISVTNGKNPLYYGEYEVEKGVLTMQESGSKKIAYKELRMKDSTLSAIFSDKDIEIHMIWKKR
jgi:hypothetical protein